MVWIVKIYVYIYDVKKKEKRKDNLFFWGSFYLCYRFRKSEMV